MSDQYEQGKESEIEEGQPAIEEVSPSQYLTKDEAEKYFKNIEDSVIARQVGIYGTGQQKLLEKLEALETNIKSLRDAGVEVTPAAEMKLRDNAYKEALTSGANNVSQRVEQPAAQRDQPQGINPQQVNSIAANLLQTLGVKFSEKDPELKMIKTNGDPMEYLDSLTKAASAWKERNSDKPNPEARIPGLVTGSTSEKDLKAAYDKELKAARADPFNAKEKALQIRRKYRALGLPGL